MTLFIDRFLDGTLPGLTKAMDLTLKRNNAIVSNIANAETPMYRAVDVDFSNELRTAFNRAHSALSKTDTRHMDIGEGRGAHLKADLSGATKPDGNNVDIDVQMGRLAYNSGKYSTAAAIVRKQLSLLKNAIRDAR